MIGAIEDASLALSTIHLLLEDALALADVHSLTMLAIHIDRARVFARQWETPTGAPDIEPFG